MRHQHTLHLDRGDIFAPRDDNVLGPVCNLDIAVGVLHGEVAGVEITVLEGLGRGLRVLQVALHHHIAAQPDLSLALAVHRQHVVFAVAHHHRLQHWHGDTLAGFLGGDACLVQPVPVLCLPVAFGDMAEGFGKPVDMGDVKAQVLDLRQRRRGGRGACRKDLDRVAEGAPLLVQCVNQHVQHDRRAAEMGDALVMDGVVDVLCADIAGKQTRVPPTSGIIQVWFQPLQWNSGTMVR